MREPQQGRRSRRDSHRGHVSGWVVFLTAGFCFASNTAGEEIPFQLEGHFILVQGSIGDLADLNVVIDTGASSTTVSRAIANRLKLRGRPKQVQTYGSKVTVESVTLPAVQVGPMRFEEVPAWVAELSFPDMRRSLQIDALIGLDFLKRTNLSVDFEAGTLRFGSIDHSESSLAFYGDLPFVLIPLRIDGRVVRLLLDTAAPDVILFERRAEGRVPMNRTSETKGIRSEAGPATLRKVHLSNLALGPTSWETFSAFLMDGRPPDSGIDGILGPVSLGLKRLHLDFEQNRISWER